MLKKISARHFELTDEMRSKAEAEMDGLKKFFENIISAELVLDTERHLRKAELKVQVYNSTITGSAESNDMYQSISTAFNKATAQLKKYKDKLKSKHPETIVGVKDMLTQPTTDVDEIE